MNEKTLLIINPKSGKLKRKKVFESVCATVGEKASNLDIVYTEYKGHATEIAKNAGQYKKVICMGGDGTLNEVCNGLLSVAKEVRPPIGYIPAGSTNDFARGIGLPKSIKKASKLTVSDEHSPIDIGSFKDSQSNTRFFTYVASFGLFTKISYSTNQDIKNKFGHFAYIFEGIRSISELQKIKPFKLRIETDDTVLEQEYIFGAITNSTSLGGLVKLDKKNVHVNDGLFELLLIRKPKSFLALADTVRQIISKKYCFERIIFSHTSKLKLTSDCPLDWTLDGEFAGSTETAEINVLPSELNFIRPDEVRTKTLILKKQP